MGALELPSHLPYWYERSEHALPSFDLIQQQCIDGFSIGSLSCSLQLFLYHRSSYISHLLYTEQNYQGDRYCEYSQGVMPAFQGCSSHSIGARRAVQVVRLRVPSGLVWKVGLEADCYAGGYNRFTAEAEKEPFVWRKEAGEFDLNQYGIPLLITLDSYGSGRIWHTIEAVG